MKLYRIKNWSSQFENNRSRELKKLDWFAMPNKQDGDGYTQILLHQNGEAIFGAWCACAQIASRCDPRGTLLRDGGKPHDSASLSRMSRFSEKTITEMLSVCSSPDINWLESEEYTTTTENPAPSCEIAASSCLEGKGREGNGKEEHPNGVLGLFSEHSPKPFAADPVQVRIGALFRRRPATRWSDDEQKSYKKIIPVDEQDLRILETYYTARIPQDSDIRRRDLVTLLNNFNGELDRARKFKPSTCL